MTIGVATLVALVFGASVGAMRVIFGRHFVSDTVFAGIVTIAIVMAFYRLLIEPVRRNDARLEMAISRTSIALHKATGAAQRKMTGVKSKVYTPIKANAAVYAACEAGECECGRKESTVRKVVDRGYELLARQVACHAEHDEAA